MLRSAISGIFDDITLLCKTMIKYSPSK